LQREAGSLGVTDRSPGRLRRLGRVNRRSLVALLAAGLLLSAPAGALAANPDALFASAASGTLSNTPTADTSLAATDSQGTLSGTPTPSGEKQGGTKAAAAPAASTLPFTGSDPRITLLLGVAALLAGAGLRLRTGDARDY
jgi:hypothetical protein